MSSSAVPLVKRRKNELTDIALTLGLSGDGTKEIILERIRNYISAYGSNDPVLRDLAREGTPETSPGLASVSTTANIARTTQRRSTRRPSLDDSSDNVRLSGRSTSTFGGNLEEKHEVMEQGRDGDDYGRENAQQDSQDEIHSEKRSSLHSRFDDEDQKEQEQDEDREEPLMEHKVSEFMDHMQDEIREATTLAQELRNTLRSEVGLRSRSGSGSDSERARSKRISSRRTSTSSLSSNSQSDRDRDAYEDSTQADEELAEARHRHDPHPLHQHQHQHQQHRQYQRDESHRHGHHHRLGHEGHEEDEGVFLRQVAQVWRNAFVQCACVFGLPASSAEMWQSLQDVGSTSTGFVWLTFLLEFGVFMYQACSEHQQNPQAWHEWRALLTDWSHVLKPFFAYYVILFMLPTLLSQMFNVDCSQPHGYGHTYGRSRGGGAGTSTSLTTTRLLSRRTTSGLSFFVFKFALTYWLSVTLLRKDLCQDVSPWTLRWICGAMKAALRHVPAALSLVTSGIGTVLALAESVVASR